MGIPFLLLLSKFTQIIQTYVPCVDGLKLNTSYSYCDVSLGRQVRRKRSGSDCIVFRLYFPDKNSTFVAKKLKRAVALVLALTLRWPQHNIYVNGHTQLQTKVMLFFPFHSSHVTKIAWLQNTIRDFSYSKKYLLLHYNVVSRMCFHLNYFYNVSPLKISNHNAFYNFLSGYNALHTLDKMDRNRLLKDNTSLLSCNNNWRKR